jgi:hypothetical protein
LDATTFDVLVRSLAQSGTRRGLLGRGAIAAAGATLAGLGLRDVAAAEECRGSGLRCRRDAQCCSGKCRDRVCKPADLQVGETCDPDVPTDCVTDVCGCLFEDQTRCTCRRATCLEDSGESGESGCDSSADCCEGACVTDRGLCVVFRRGQPS